MADEPIFTTIRVDQLPPQAITASSAIPHALGTTLYKGLISEIIALLPQSVSYRPYEVKQLNVTDLYITQNFTLDGTASSGLGKSDGLWSGWAIMNGNNGTTNMDGAIALGYGVNNNSMRAQIGEDQKLVNVPTSGFQTGSTVAGAPSGRLIVSSGLSGSLDSIRKVGDLIPQLSFSVRQKSYVQLFIMKLP